MFNRISALIGMPSGFLILIFFILPWITISCEAVGFGDEKLVSPSGLDLATGDAYDDFQTAAAEQNEATSTLGADSFFGEEVYSDPNTTVSEVSLTFDDVETDASFDALKADGLLWLIPIAGVLVLVVAGLSMAGLLPSVIAGAIYLLAAIFGLAVYIMKYLDLQNLANYLDNNTGDIDYGFLVTLRYEASFYMTAFALMGALAAGLVALMIDDFIAQGPPDRSGRPPSPDLSFFEETSATVDSSHRPSWFNE